MSNKNILNATINGIYNPDDAYVVTGTKQEGFPNTFIVLRHEDIEKLLAGLKAIGHEATEDFTATKINCAFKINYESTAADNESPLLPNGDIKANLTVDGPHFTHGNPTKTALVTNPNVGEADILKKNPLAVDAPSFAAMYVPERSDFSSPSEVVVAVAGEIILKEHKNTMIAAIASQLAAIGTAFHQSQPWYRAVASCLVALQSALIGGRHYYAINGANAAERDLIDIFAPTPLATNKIHINGVVWSQEYSHLLFASLINYGGNMRVRSKTMFLLEHLLIEDPAADETLKWSLIWRYVHYSQRPEVIEQMSAFNIQARLKDE